MTAPANPGHAPAVRLRGVGAGYDGRVVLAAMDLDVPAGSLLAVFGPNGGGKSTFLKLVAGLLRQMAGTIEVLGEPPGRQSRRIAYVPQAELVDWSFPVTVGDVAMMGRYALLGPIRAPGKRDHAVVRAALERVGMAALAGTRIEQLSGGQRRRAFLARAIASEPELFLLDEPVTGVDVPTQQDLMALLAEEAAAGRTVVATTHDLAAVARDFRTAVAINGRILATGAASIVSDPAVLDATYGGHLVVVGDRAVILDDAHHHDSPSGR
ncbi:MAG TPA: metal ABC transporter ATP-binding protein, partial [Candidatus Limnocylindrales bacterium]|nr:metal ABC transporter ATP-binding protein [Candidatus Limnocylindrales bacterium]